MGRIGTIIQRKGKQDAKRSKEFTKVARLLSVATREGGPDPSYNASLASAIEKAKAINMPNDNIERTIKKASGEADGAVYTEVVYEGYGPGGVAVIVECLTDNINRTAADVRANFSKYGGNLGTNGCVTFMFDYKGVLAIVPEEEGGSFSDEKFEELEMDIMESGASDYSQEEGYVEVLTEPSDFAAVRDFLSKKGYKFSMAELRYLPQTMIKLDKESDIKNMTKMIDVFEDDDDIQNVYHNFEEPEE